MVPFPELANFDGSAIESLETSPEVTCEEEGLELDLAGQRGRLFSDPSRMRGAKELKIIDRHEETFPASGKLARKKCSVELSFLK